MQIDIPSILIQAIEDVARAEGKPANDWIISQLENAVAQSQKLAAERRNFEEERREEREVKIDKHFEEMTKIHQSWTGL
jgi:hypothetical protein